MNPMAVNRCHQAQTESRLLINENNNMLLRSVEHGNNGRISHASRFNVLLRLDEQTFYSLLIYFKSQKKSRQNDQFFFVDSILVSELVEHFETRKSNQLPNHSIDLFCVLILPSFSYPKYD